MVGVTLFFTEKNADNMNKLTWLELYDFLHKQDNELKNIGNFNWQSPVIIHDGTTGDEFECDTMYISDSRGTDRFVLMTNIESIFKENSSGSRN